MLNYIFFDDDLRARFAEFLLQRGVTHKEQPDPMGTSVVGVSEELPEDLLEAIEDYYDDLSRQQEKRLEDSADRLEMNRTGIRVTLSDGRPCMVRLDADVVGRLLTVLTLDELQQLVTTITRAGENPDDRPVCQDP